jgi:hypothetical protein
MAEKKHVVKNLKLTYNGPLSVEEFYAEVEKWMGEKGLIRDLKRKSEEITKKGKNVEWIIEMWKQVTHPVRHVIRLRVVFKNVREIKLKRKGKMIKFNQADLITDIDGFVESHLSTLWTMQPLYQFVRTLIDKYIWSIGMTETERLEGPVRDYCYDLHKRIKSFLSLYKMKLQ